MLTLLALLTLVAHAFTASERARDAHPARSTLSDPVMTALVVVLLDVVAGALLLIVAEAGGVLFTPTKATPGEVLLLAIAGAALMGLLTESVRHLFNRLGSSLVG